MVDDFEVDEEEGAELAEEEEKPGEFGVTRRWSSHRVLTFCRVTTSVWLPSAMSPELNIRLLEVTVVG